MSRFLYVAGNREGSYEQLKRYLRLFKQPKHQFKIAGYKNSLKEINADYCLDALLNFTNPNGPISFNGNFAYYGKEISKFKPDLIISDFDIHTSIYAIDKGIPLWQVSPALLYYGMSESLKRSVGIHKYNSNLISGDRARHQYIKSILLNSQRKLVISHLCDIEHPPELSYGYEWCRPEFELSDLCGAESNGTETSLSDVFYNGKYASMKLSQLDIETITGIYCNIHFELGQLEQNNKLSNTINININNNAKFLMELIK
jgi:hypothetical protein